MATKQFQRNLFFILFQNFSYRNQPLYLIFPHQMATSAMRTGQANHAVHQTIALPSRKPYATRIIISASAVTDSSTVWGHVKVSYMYLNGLSKSQSFVTYHNLLKGADRLVCSVKRSTYISFFTRSQSFLSNIFKFRLFPLLLECTFKHQKANCFKHIINRRSIDLKC